MASNAAIITRYFILISFRSWFIGSQHRSELVSSQPTAERTGRRLVGIFRQCFWKRFCGSLLILSAYDLTLGEIQEISSGVFSDAALGSEARSLSPGHIPACFQRWTHDPGRALGTLFLQGLGKSGRVLVFTAERKKPHC
ncbi:MULTISPECIES: hypothetical protein [Bradyrhizobium]|nr:MULTISPECIES: hypothetical protein [Bradyrhizobium]